MLLLLADSGPGAMTNGDFLGLCRDLDDAGPGGVVS
jgi:hypothetical protein